MGEYMTEVLNDVTVELNEREKVMLKALREMYGNRKGNLVVSVIGISYQIRKKFLDMSVEQERRMFECMKYTIFSLAEKRVITIVEKDFYANNFVLSSKGLKAKRERCRCSEESLQNSIIKISDEKIIEFYITNGLVPIRKYICERSGKTIYEFCRDKENKRLYKQWCEMERERRIKRYKEIRGIK